ncbi:MAG: 30S ribosome-binding factor RbfA [Candidatus Nealsonbacteria bacterium]|nr:30S ribosome-binding factor RbfA [Candidatus Nealsonbacteria bacterium]
MSRRIERVNKVILEELSKILKREVEFSPGVLVTITRVETSQDLRQASVYISTIPEEKKKEVFGLIRKNIYQIQGLLNQAFKIKIMPRISFLEEKETKKAAEVEVILEKIKGIEKD